jgi:hypothetical protein
MNHRMCFKKCERRQKLRFFLYSAIKGVTPSVKLSDFTVWHHTWRKNWVNCAVLTGKAQASELSFPVVFHTENCAVYSGNPTVSSVYLVLSTIVTRTRRHTELTNLTGNLSCAREHSVQFFVQVFYTVKLHSLN